MLDIVAAAIFAGQDEDGFVQVDRNHDVRRLAVEQFGFEGS
jgi:hypothetical protein